jgi:hypothetical protein
MSLYIPTIQREYLVPAMLDNKAWASMLASGVIDPDLLSVTVEGGDYVNIPTINRAVDFTHQTLAQTASVSFASVDSTSDKAVVLSDISANQFYKSQLRQVDPELGVKLSQTIGMRLAKRLARQLFAGADAAIQAMSNTAHTQSQTTAMTLDTVRKAKLKMADYADEITTAVVHSKVWSDLIYDLYTNYKVAGIADIAVIKGALAAILGIEDWIISDLAPVGPGATSSAGDDLYTSFLFGPKSLAVSFQQDPETEFSANMSSLDGGPGITNQDTIIYVKTTVKYLTHV